VGLGTLSAQLLHKSTPSHLSKCPTKYRHSLKVYKARAARVLGKGQLLPVTWRKPPGIRGLDINDLWCGRYVVRTYRIYFWYFQFHTWVHMSNPPSSVETYLPIHKGRANSHIPPHLSNW